MRKKASPVDSFADRPVASATTGETFDGVPPGMRHLALTTAPLLATLGLFLAAPPVRAEEPRKVSEPSVLQEPAEVTNVVDAFDDNDKFDLNLTLGFQQTWKNGNIHRETHSDLNQFSSGGFTAGN